MNRLPSENLKKIVLFLSSYCPLKISTLKTYIKDKEFCKQDIFKTITARSFKLCQLLEDDDKITW